mmetsp:Transcript_60068/g.99709  ORF Transcript_60068/g.99709 Transcript_60068/m.99709 type:complete len:285 (+) Transcript_60068:172-1026(+)
MVAFTVFLLLASKGCRPLISSPHEFAHFSTNVVASHHLGFTDKTEWHGFERTYFPRLKDLRRRTCDAGGKGVRLLEIGLGAGNRTGASVALWRSFFGRQATLHFLEYDPNTAQAVQAQHPHMMSRVWVGDQNNASLLAQIVEEGGGGYDVIIDDGAHTMSSITSTVRNLFLALKPDGFLFVEDMHTVFSPAYGGNPLPTARGNAAVLFQHLLVDQLCLAVAARCERLHEPTLSPMIASVECSRELCILTRAKTAEQDDWTRVHEACVGTTRCDCGPNRPSTRCI